MIVGDINFFCSEVYKKAKEQQEIKDVLVIFDEPSSYLNDDFISLVNKGRGAGIHAIFSPQTMADVDRINIHLKNQLVGNVNTFFIGKTNAPNEIEFWGNVMGTYNDIDVTDWLPEKENNVYQDGSVQETLELFEDEKKREGKEETEKEENKSSKSKMKFNPEAF
ncbi:TraM recognition domain-containing protein [Enterococcus faecium]|uniref:TraM recognition domain-containing protein n=1 Tax=Enterococcus faecium TaxID=1352 RepID=UPI00298CA42B|nr:TraM recognition domain-containing protein [Enterococcus faecium]